MTREKQLELERVRRRAAEALGRSVITARPDPSDAIADLASDALDDGDASTAALLGAAGVLSAQLGEIRAVLNELVRQK
jgi:hypothetical protein